MEITVQVNQALNQQHDFAFFSKKTTESNKQTFDSMLERAIVEKIAEKKHNEKQDIQKNQNVTQETTPKEAETANAPKEVDGDRVTEKAETTVVSENDEEKELVAINTESEKVIPSIEETPLFINSDFTFENKQAGATEDVDAEHIDNLKNAGGKKDAYKDDVDLLSLAKIAHPATKKEVAETSEVKSETEMLSDEKELVQKKSLHESESDMKILEKNDETVNIQAMISKQPEEVAIEPQNHSTSEKSVVENAPFVVIDERTEKPDKDSTSDFSKSLALDSDGNAELVMTLHDSNKNTGDATMQGNNQKVQAHFSSMLSKEIEHNASVFVKSSLITLRDGNTGSINLILRPEELGNVKINLELADKVLTGKIIVASEEAYNAFKNNLDSLKQAFTASGFESAGFELSWSGNGNGNHQQQNEKNIFGNIYRDAMPFLAENIDESAVVAYNVGYGTVNVMI